MNLSDYIKTERGNGKKLAEKLGVSPQYLSQMAAGDAAISPERASVIELESEGAVRRWELFPERWHRIWPELVGVEGAPQPSSVTEA